MDHYFSVCTDLNVSFVLYKSNTKNADTAPLKLVVLELCFYQKFTVRQVLFCDNDTDVQEWSLQRNLYFFCDSRNFRNIRSFVEGLPRTICISPSIFVDALAKFLDSRNFRNFRNFRSFVQSLPQTSCYFFFSSFRNFCSCVVFYFLELMFSSGFTNFPISCTFRCGVQSWTYLDNDHTDEW